MDTFSAFLAFCIPELWWVCCPAIPDSRFFLKKNVSAARKQGFQVFYPTLYLAICSPRHRRNLLRKRMRHTLTKMDASLIQNTEERPDRSGLSAIKNILCRNGIYGPLIPASYNIISETYIISWVRLVIRKTFCPLYCLLIQSSWWCHQMETFSA